MKCKWTDCENDARAKSPFCGDTCYKRWNRANTMAQDGSGSTNSDKVIPNSPPTRTDNSDKSNSDTTRTASISDYWEHPNDYGSRRDPDSLNWGPWMDAIELAQAGLKGNRVTLPGDWDYVGVCKCIDGVWVVKPDPPAPVEQPTHPLGARRVRNGQPQVYCKLVEPTHGPQIAQDGRTAAKGYQTAIGQGGA